MRFAVPFITAMFILLASFPTLGIPIYTLGDTSLIDTDRDSFIDTESGLEWMDFGMTNNLALSYVLNNLGAGGEYFGWRLPSESEVLDLWQKAFFDRLEGPTLSDMDGEFYEDLYMVYNRIGSNDYRLDELERLFDIISYNYAPNIGSGYGFYYGLGWFYSADGTIDYARFQVYERWRPEIGFAQIYQGGDYQHYLDVVSPYTATFLVKSVTSVTEPSSLVVIFVVMLFIFRKKFSVIKRQKP